MASNGSHEYHRTIANPLHEGIIELELKGVTLRFYPLRAKFDTLQKFCDDYLNFGPFSDDKQDNNRPLFSFRPALPFVLLIVLDYDRLEVEGVPPGSFGAGLATPVPETWLRQHEVIFGVPLEWYEGRGSQRRFKDWGMTAPFIYLDHPISIWIGREAFGWPKTSMHLPRLRPIFKAAEPRYLASIQIPVPSGNPERSEIPEQFLEIFNDPTMEGSAPQIANPFSMVSSAISNYLQAASAIASSLAGVRVPNLGRPEESAATQQMLQKGVDSFAGWLPMLSAMVTQGSPPDMAKFAQSPFMQNNITLKQFYDAQDTKYACYQALVRSSVTVKQMHRAGFLFNPLSPDSSGGTIVKLHVPSDTKHKIIDTLGLETEGLEQKDGVYTRILKPYYPFWYNLDLKYEPQDVLSWRGISTEWAPPTRSGEQRKDGGKASYIRIGSGVLPPKKDRADADLVIRVLPLKATKLAELCNGLSNLKACSHSFTPISDHVLLSVIQFRSADQRSPSAGPRSGRARPDQDILPASALPPSGLLADTEIVFAIPAKCSDGKNRERSVLLPMLGFVGAEFDAFSDREIYGRLSLQSSLLPPWEKLLEDLDPDEKKFEELFYVRTSLCRSLSEDEETRLWPILDFVEKLPANGSQPPPPPGRPRLPDRWVRDLGLEMFDQRRLVSIALKQFRDAKGKCTDTCYQALVEYEGTFSEQPDYGWIEQDLALRVYTFQTVDIVKYFGLETSSPELHERPGNGPDRTDFNTVRPHYPFWIKAKISSESARNLCLREGVGDWHDVTTK